MPGGAKLLGVSGEIHVIGAEAAPSNQLSAWGFSGEVLPLPDIDSSIDINVLWDNLVTKPVLPAVVAETSQVDVDWDTANSDPDVEAGEIDLNEMFGIVDATKTIVKPQLEWMSFAKGNPIATLAGTPDTYTPRSYKTFRSNRQIRVDLPSYAMLAISSPNLSQQQVTESTDTTARFWATLRNFKEVLGDMWRGEVGMAEAGALKPYDDITDFIAQLIAPAIIDPSSTLLDPMQYTCFMIAEWIMDIPDNAIPNVIEAHAG